MMIWGEIFKVSDTGSFLELDWHPGLVLFVWTLQGPPHTLHTGVTFAFCYLLCFCLT